MVVLVLGEGDMLCYDFKHAVVEVFGDLEHAGEVVAEFGYDELFGVVFFHFTENFSHHGCVNVSGDLGEVFGGEVVGIACGLVYTHFEADAGGNLGFDVFYHQRYDHEVGDVFDNHADGMVELLKAFGFGVYHFTHP